MTNRRFPHERSQKIADQLDPKLANLCSQLSPALRSRIDGLVEKAGKLTIHPNRVVKYAFLRATAEQQARGDAASEEHARRSKAELAGELHGFREGYRHPAEAIERYRRSRRGRQQIQASIEGCLRKWVAAEKVLRKHRLDLPVHQQARFSEESLGGVRKLLFVMARTTVLDEEVLGKKSRGREPNVTQQTYIWWHFSMARYEGKTNEMYQLAKVWKLSAVKDVEIFRSMVNQIRRGARSMRYPIGSAWESVLFETP